MAPGTERVRGAYRVVKTLYKQAARPTLRVITRTHVSR